MQRNKKTIRKGNRQKAWQYMRRNPMFAVKDILLILDDMSENSLRLLVRQLLNNNYLMMMKSSKVFKERSYKLIKNTGVVCPVWVDKQRKLYDANIDAFGVKEHAYTPKESKKIEQRPVKPLDYAKGRIEQILNIESDGISILQLSTRSGVNGNKFSAALKALVDAGVAEHIDYENGVPLYRRCSDDEC